MADMWIMSDGGPLIVLDKAVKEQWGGTITNSYPADSSAHDYDRAFHLYKFMKKIEMPSSEGLSLGDVPMDTGFWRSKHSALCIVRISFCETDFDVDNAMKTFYETKQCLTPKETLDFRFFGRALVMFDSAAEGCELDLDYRKADLEPGHYRIDTYAFDPDTSTSLVIHCFERSS